MEKMRLPEDFGSNLFSDAVMKERLPEETLKALADTIENGAALSREDADIIAGAMKDWAIAGGATHYTHWFQPMTGITAEKHDSFISPSKEGKAILEFSGKELIKGEPDASSFPSGGLRATFEARGYTAWDPTSYAFIKGNTLCIPTAFYSYGGEALDKKTPLLRSMDALSREGVRLLRFFGTDCKRVIAESGPEQEYFLVDKNTHDQRLDLILTGRTLFGAKPPKGQEMDDHYFGSIKDRVSDFMSELDEELWKLGIYAKTEHNEAAPSQHELAPVYTTVNIATDQNQITMELMKKIARKHGLICLLHPKPFEGVNGSGKHNNWSISTDTGESLLKPGKDPAHNMRFLVIFCAVIEAVSRYSDILRACVATAGNDHRLGGNEAPPAIISIFLGDMLTEILRDIAENKTLPDFSKEKLAVGVGSLPVINKDTSDRNRTSPFAFSGTKFEFRMPSSAQSVAGINLVINTMVAQVFSEYSQRLAAAEDIDAEKRAIIRDTYNNHKNIIFNGNNYTEEWRIEAERRGLPNLTSSPRALLALKSRKSIALFSENGVLSEQEINSRCEILSEEYYKTVNIEALTMADIAGKQILPACIAYGSFLCDSVSKRKALSMPCENLIKLSDKVNMLTEKLISETEALERLISKTPKGGCFERSIYAGDKILPAMKKLRAVADELETLVSKDYWPLPAYSDLLYNV